MWVVFFFQAEDGIRDYDVTGVQTCALPISALGMSEEETQTKFGFLLNALKFGAPPHGGIAFGLDRLVMMMVGTSNIRDVIAFPKTQTGADLMCKAPSEADPAHLKELGITVSVPDEATSPE